MLDLLLKDNTWLLAATATALLAVIALVLKQRRLASRRTILTCALNLFWGLWIGIMGTGHLFAVTTKAMQGTLSPAVHLWFAIPMGFALAVPGWLLVANIRGLTRKLETPRKIAIGLNGLVGLVLAVVQLPLVVPPALNLILLASQREKRVPA